MGLNFKKGWSRGNIPLWSILSTFYTRIFFQYFGAKKSQSRNINRENLRKALLYKKIVHKMSRKYTPSEKGPKMLDMEKSLFQRRETR